MIFLIYFIAKHLLNMVLPKRLLATFEEGTGFITCPMCQGKGICLKLKGEQEPMVFLNRGFNFKEELIPPQRPTSNDLNEPFRLPVLARSKRNLAPPIASPTSIKEMQPLQLSARLDTPLALLNMPVLSISETNLVSLPSPKSHHSRHSFRGGRLQNSRNDPLRFSLDSLNRLKEDRIIFSRSKSMAPLGDMGLDSPRTVDRSLEESLSNATSKTSYMSVGGVSGKPTHKHSTSKKQESKNRQIKKQNGIVQSLYNKEMEQSCQDMHSPVAAVVKKAPVNYELELLPMNDEPEMPQELLRSALIKLRKDDWSKNVEGIEEVIQVCRYFPSMVDPFMTVINRALIVLLHSLRSLVVRLACQASFEIFRTNHNIQRPEFDELVTMLLSKTADMNKYIRQDANEALDSMIRNVAPCHSVRALISRGFSHKNPLVRTAIVRLLTCLVTINGPEVILYSVSAGNAKETRKKILNMLAQYLGDSNLITRTYSKKLFKSLKNHPDFEHHFYNDVDRKTLTKIGKTLETLRYQNGESSEYGYN